MSVYRKEYSGEFTDYVIIEFPIGKEISSFFSRLSKHSFLEIFNLAENYISKHVQTDYSFALIDPTCLNDLPFYHKTSDGEVLLDVKSRAMYHLNLLSNKGEIYYKNKKFISAKDKDVEAFLDQMIQKNSILVHEGENHSVVFLVADPSLGILSEYVSPNNIVINSHFFLMEMFELKSYHSCLGQPYGGLLIDGKIINPPLYERPALFISKDGKSYIETLSIEDFEVIIDNTKYSHGQDAKYYRRPEYSISPNNKGTDLVIINNKIMGYKYGGETYIPEAGYILHVNEKVEPSNREIKYSYDDNLQFLIQVGPALIKDGEMINKINGEFYWDRVKRDKNCPYFPPVVFETEWEEASAARMALGIKESEILILWASGCNSEKYIPGYDSKGFTFSEITEIFYDEQVENAISLDGGGSAQLLTMGGKALKLSDRRGHFGIEYERPTPMGLKITI
ncbi:MAG: phosphodiester glycosidase family protein [Kosmotogaceae bacterium]